MLPRHNRWAAKEAAYKALYPAYRATWKELQLIKEGPKPTLVFKPKEPTRADEGALIGALAPASPPPSLLLSLSHDADLLIAYVIAQKP